MTETTTTTQKIPTPNEVFAFIAAEQAVKKAKEEDEYQQMRADVIRALRSGKTEDIELNGTQIPRLISELEAVGWVTTVKQARGLFVCPTLTVQNDVLGDGNLTTSMRLSYSPTK